MTVSIPQDLEEFVSDQVRTGRFSDPQAVVRKALSAMREFAIVDGTNEEELRHAVRIGIEALDNGESGPWDPEAIKATGRRLMQERAARGV